jgi:hypothetical protein
MVTKGKNNDLPDKDTLIRYLKGKLPPDEAHRIEKLILSDPLYQDALDGLDTLSEEELEQDLKDLSQQISAKTHSSAKGTTFSYYRVAAAIILLAVFSYVIVYTTSRMGDVSQNETLSQKKELPEEGEQAPAGALVEESDKPETQTSETDMELRKKAVAEQEMDKTVSDPMKQSSEESIDIIEEKTDAAIALYEAKKTEPVLPIEESIEVDALAVSEESLEEATLDEVEDFEEKEEELSIIDQELDQEIQAEPLAIDRTDEENAIDIRSNEIENLNLEQEAEIAEISAEPAPVLSDFRDSTGGKRKENKLARQAERQVAAFPETEGEPKAYAESETEDILKPVPVDGYEMYTEYIRENLKYPSEELENKIHGSVKLRFIINKDSIPDKIRVIQSLSPGCDKEAKRLLLEGPKWIPVYMNGEFNESELEYVIYFQVEN